MEASSGVADVFGRPAREARADTGYLTQTFSLYPDLTVRENLRYLGDLRRVPRAELDRRAMRYLRMFDMDQFVDRLAGKLSGGMKQKLSLACALVPEPQVLLLDEPTTGVDPVSRREFWDALVHLAVDGLTILVATPYLDEAERCHRVALMHEGVIRQTGTPDELRRSAKSTRLEVRTPHLGRAERVLFPISGPGKDIVDVQRFGDRLDVLVRHPDAGERLIRSQLAEAAVTVEEIRSEDPLLENIFVAELRKLGHEVEQHEFPGLAPHQDLIGRVAVGAAGLSKDFGAFHAVRDVTLQVRYGEVYGLLGANGAGKTTTIKMLCGLLDPTRGVAQLAGVKGNIRSPAVRRRVGYMSQKFSLYDDLPVDENLEFFAGVYDVPEAERAAKIEWVLKLADLEDQAHQLVGSLPGGWKQRVAFGAAIMHEPEVLFLDEPTSGVDLLARRMFWNLINRLVDLGTAILVTTHYLEEAEQCNRLGMMVAGELVAEGSPSGLKAAQQGHLIELYVDQPQLALDRLKGAMDRWRVSLFGDRLHVISADAVDRGIADVTARLQAGGVNVQRAREVRFSLEDVFISIVEQARLQGKFSGEA
jgi:ABC-2 type transport system ATP-binding protein